MNTAQDRWEFLELDNPTVKATNELYRWSLNFDPGYGPFTLLLDLIGWSGVNIGEQMYRGGTIGSYEADILGRSLLEYSTHGNDVWDWVEKILELEMSE